MKLNTKKDIMIYLMHKFFSNFTLNLFFIFWALLIYKKTNSMWLTLSYYLVHYIFIVLNISLLLKLFLKILNNLKTKFTMILWLILISFWYILLFSIPSDLNFYKIILFWIAFLIAIWSNFYYIPFNTINFLLIWNSKNPWIWASFLSSNSIFAWIIASILALFMNLNDNISLLLLIAWISLLTSCIFLYFINIPHKNLDIKFSSYIKLIPFKDGLGFMELTHEIKNIWLPLVTFYSFHSLSTSVNVSSLIALWTILVVFFAWHLKDKENNILFIICSILWVISWFAYSIISSEMLFIILGIIVWLTYKVINTNFEANFWRKLSNSWKEIDFSLANDFYKISWRIIVIVILILTYYLTQNIGQLVLILWWIFLIPKVFYWMKKMDLLKNT